MSISATDGYGNHAFEPAGNDQLISETISVDKTQGDEIGETNPPALSSITPAQGSVLTNKYAEGYPGRRWYGGCQNVDEAERLAVSRAKKLFGAEHVNVQPHAGTQANRAVYNVILEPGDTMLSMDLTHGGHLSHGHDKNFSGRTYKAVFYGVNRDTEVIDYDEVEKLAHTCTHKSQY